MVFRWSSNKIVSGIPVRQPRWLSQPNSVKQRTLWEIQLKIFLSKTAEPIATNLLENGPQIVLYQNKVGYPSPPTKMAVTAELSLKYDLTGDSLENLLV